MTLATVLMLLACFMIGATIALANPVKAADTVDTYVSAPRDTQRPVAKTPHLQQADPDSAKRPYQETLAEGDAVDQYNFDGLTDKADQNDNQPSSYAALSNC
jgi:hypothetical protein